LTGEDRLQGSIKVNEGSGKDTEIATVNEGQKISAV
jgi:hypothetical protein